MSTVRTQALALGVCPATITNYRRALRAEGKRITVSTLRAHGNRQTPGRKANHERNNKIRHLRDEHDLTWAAIGKRFRISPTRACAIYNQHS